MTTQAVIATIKKTDEDQRLVFGEVYAPDKLDSQDDFMSAETIQSMAYNFMANTRQFNVDTNHDRKPNGSVVVESFIAREGDPDFIPGSWVVGVYVPDDAVWEMVKSGELNGFSLDGNGVRKEIDVTLIIPEILKGRTLPGGEDEHEHEFIVGYDEDGNFIGGWTDVGPDGFRHEIKRGTVTEKANGHVHRFSFIEGVILVHEDQSESE